MRSSTQLTEEETEDNYTKLSHEDRAPQKCVQSLHVESHRAMYKSSPNDWHQQHMCQSSMRIFGSFDFPVVKVIIIIIWHMPGFCTIVHNACDSPNYMCLYTLAATV